MRKKVKFILFVAITVLFLLLSYVKFFTVQISYSEDPTVTIVKTNKINLLANFYTINTPINDSYLGHDQKITIIHADERGNKWHTIYSFSILFWWVILFYFCVIAIKLIYSKLILLLKK